MTALPLNAPAARPPITPATIRPPPASAGRGIAMLVSFAGPSVIVSRDHARDGRAQAVVVISKNANVATGVEGLANTHEVVAGIADAVGCAEDDVLIASTGVIGRQYPMGRVRAGL